MTASSLPCIGIVENYLIPLITDNIIHEFGMMGMPNENCKTDWRTSTKRSTGTSDNLYPVITLTGDSLNRNAQNELYVMPKGDKSQAVKVREMTLKIRQGYGAFVVVRERESRSHGKGTQLICTKIEVN